MRRSFYLGLVAVALVALGSVATALLIRSNEVDHFHTQQTDEAGTQREIEPGPGGREALGGAR